MGSEEKNHYEGLGGMTFPKGPRKKSNIHAEDFVCSGAFSRSIISCR